MDIKMKPLLETLQLLDISDEEYFSSKYSNYISNSKLKYMNPEQGGSPSIFKEGIPFTASPSLILGSAVHCITLQPNDFVLAPLTTKPTAKLGIMADELYKTFENTCNITDEDVIQASDKVDYYKGKLTAERIAEVKNKCRPYLEGRLDWITRTNDTREPIFLDSKMWEIATACINSINKDKEIQSLLNPESFDAYVLNEGTLLMDVEANVDGMTTILKLKAKLDSFTIDVARNRIILNDLKTTGHLVRDFGNSFKFYHYSRQGARIHGTLNSDIQLKTL